MSRANRDIRLAAAGAGVYLWQIAKELNLQDSNFSRKLRNELPPEEKKEMLMIIERLKKEADNDAENAKANM